MIINNQEAIVVYYEKNNTSVVHLHPSYRENIIFNGDMGKVQNESWKTRVNIFFKTGKITSVGTLKSISKGNYVILEDGSSIHEDEFDKLLGVELAAMCEEKGYNPSQMREDGSVAEIEAKLVRAKFNEKYKVVKRETLYEKVLEDYTYLYKFITIPNVKFSRWITGIFEQGVDVTDIDINKGYYVVKRKEIIFDTLQQLCEKYNLTYSNNHDNTVRYIQVDRKYVMSDNFANQLQAMDYDTALKVVESTKEVAIKAVSKLLASRLSTTEREKLSKDVKSVLTSLGYITCKNKASEQNLKDAINTLKTISNNMDFAKALELLNPNADLDESIIEKQMRDFIE